MEQNCRRSARDPSPDVETVLCEVDLPANYPNDPADRIIGVTALIEDIPLLTADAQIRKSRAVPTIW